MKKLLLIALVSFVSRSHSQINLLNGLQACYPLDCDVKNYAPTTIGTPPSLNGTPFNVNCTSGHTGAPNTAYQFLGSTSSYIELPNDLRIKSDSISFTGWFKLDSLPNIQYLVYTKNNCTSNFEAYYLATFNSGTGQRFSVGKSGGSCNYAQLSSNVVLSLGSWYHVAFYIDNNAIKLYINGVLDNSMTHSVAFSYNTAKRVYLGVTNESYYNLPFKGRMDNLRFYNRELNATEVADIYNRDPACRAEAKTVGIISETMDFEGLQIYPNPNTGKMYVEVPLGYSIAIQDISGKNVAFTQNPINANITEIKLMDNAEGFYFVKTIDKTGKILQTSKVAVTH